MRAIFPPGKDAEVRVPSFVFRPDLIFANSDSSVVELTPSDPPHILSLLVNRKEFVLEPDIGTKTNNGLRTIFGDITVSPTPQPLNSPTPQIINISTPQPLTHSTPQIINPPIPQRLIPPSFHHPEMIAPSTPSEPLQTIDLPELLRPGGRRRLGKSSRTHHFKPLISLLISHFLDLSIPHTSDLHPFDYEIAIRVLRRKLPRNFAETISKKSLTSAENFYILAENSRGKSAKRVEENNKFVFKHTLKKLKSDFAKSKKYSDASKTEEEFYRYYFGEIVSKTPNSQLSDFYDPLNNRKKRLANAPKTLSLAYLELVFKSSRFREDFEKYVAFPTIETSKLVEDYAVGVRQKLEKIFYAWEKKFEQSTSPSETIKAIMEYFDSNQQCKLPWTKEEIVVAIRVFLELIVESTKVSK